MLFVQQVLSRYNLLYVYVISSIACESFSRKTCLDKQTRVHSSAATKFTRNVELAETKLLRASLRDAL